MAKRIAYDTPAPKPQCQNSLRTDFYLYFLRRPDKIDPLDPSKGQPFYVGKGCNGRVGEHRREARSLLHKSGRKNYKISTIHHLWKQGLDFQEEIYLIGLSEQDAFDLEAAVIEQYGRKDLGVGCLANSTNGGEGSSGRIATPESIEKNRQAHLGENNSWFGKQHTLETREKMSQSALGENNPMFGKPQTPESNEKRRQTQLGRKATPESIEKNRQSHLGKKPTPETREKLRISHLGNKATPETREKMSQAQRLRHQREREARNGS